MLEWERQSQDLRDILEVERMKKCRVSGKTFAKLTSNDKQSGQNGEGCMQFFIIKINSTFYRLVKYLHNSGRTNSPKNDEWKTWRITGDSY